MDEIERERERQKWRGTELQSDGKRKTYLERDRETE